jgi:hypothetical protein
MMTLGCGFPTTDIGGPETLIVVHVVAIGWLSLLMCGALLQFVPVLVAQPLHSDALALPALVSLIVGLTALILGFLKLHGHIEAPIPFFAVAGTLLASGFILVLWNLGRTLIAARATVLPARFVIVGLISVAVTVTLGIIFALVLDGTIEYGPLVALAISGLPIHVIAGLGGWLTFTAVGVSYRLLAMFMLAPELERKTTKGALYLGTVALTLAIVGGITAILLDQEPDLALLAAFAVGLVALALYGGDVLHLYRARKRRDIELNSRLAAWSLGSLGVSAMLLVLSLELGRLDEYVGAVVFLVSFGWLSGLGLAQLYKIVAFLTWLECYGPVLGKTQTPRVQDLVIEARARKWFLFYFFAVWTGTALLIVGNPLGFRVATAVMFVATAGIVAQLVQTRRLADVKAAIRFPEGVHRPRLLLSCHT